MQIVSADSKDNLINSNQKLPTVEDVISVKSKEQKEIVLNMKTAQVT